MGPRRWGRASGTSCGVSAVEAHRAARPFLFRDRLPIVFLLIGLLLLTGAILAAAPAAHAKPSTDTHTWTGAGDGFRWSDPANWNAGVPGYGDSVVVKQYSYDDIPGLTLTNVTMQNGLVDLTCTVAGAFGVSLTLTGTLDSTATMGTWSVPTSAGAATVVSAHGVLTLDQPITGGSAAGVLTMAGPGVASVTGANTYAGATQVAAGVWQVKDGGLPAGSPVSVADGATFEHYADWYSDPPATTTLDNVFSGPAGAELKFTNTSVRLTGDSSAFAGTTTVDTGEVSVATGLGGSLGGAGWIGGAGTVGTLAADAHLWVGFGGYGGSIDANTLHTGSAEWGDGGSFRWDVTDAAGTPGSSSDLLAVDGDLDVSATGGAFTIIPVTCNSGDFGSCDGFDDTKTYRWPIVTATGAITGFRSRAFTVDGSMFLNPTGGGTFSVQQGTYDGGPSIDLVFTPAGPTAVWDGGAGWSSPEWSISANWQGDSLPSNGDNLVFPAWGGAFNDDFLTSIGSVDLGQGASVGGSAVSIAGSMLAHMDDDSSPSWDVPTTLTNDTTITLTPLSNPTGSPFVVGQEIALEDGSGAGHALTVDAKEESRAEFYGQVTGSDGECSLVKVGTGILRLGAYGWTGSNTWAGPTYVQAGVLSIVSPGALSSHTEVHVRSGATLRAEMWDADADEDVWSNEFIGDGNIEIDYGRVTFTGTSPTFTGTLTDYVAATVASGAVLGGTADVTAAEWGYGPGTLYGLGTVQDLKVDSGGTLSPGLGDFGVGQLTASREVRWGEGGVYAVDVSDAGGAAGSGYDSLVIGGDQPGLTVGSSEASPFTLFLVSSDGSTAAECTDFESTQTYRWHVAALSGGSISGWDAAEAVQVDATQFATYNDLGGGAFTVEPSADGTSVDVVFTPKAPDTHTWDAGGGTDKWSNATNWDIDTAPTDGDSLVFPDGPPFDPVNDLDALTLHDVTLDCPGRAITGNAIVLTGALVRTVADEAEIDWHPDLQLGEEATLGSTAGIVNIKGAVSGGDLTKTGAGTVTLRHASSYTGKTVVEGGTLHLNADGALPDGSAVNIAAGATADIDPTDKGLKVYDNVFSGPEGATLRFSYGLPDITRDSSGFAGTTETDGTLLVTGSLGGTISGRGLVGGSGTVGAMDGTMVFPGMRGEESFAISTLTGSYWTGQVAGFGVADATGDSGVGYDQLRITGDVDIPPVIDGKGGLMVLPASVDGTGAIGPCEHFDPASSYRWPVVRVDGQVNGFDPAAVQVMVMPTMFTNDLGGGAFSLELTDHTTYRTLDLVFTPATPETRVWDGGGADDKWSTAANWVGDVAPRDGDTVRFAGYVRQSNTNDLLASVGGVEFATSGWVIGGDALRLGGPITSEAATGGIRVKPAVTLATDAAITSAGSELTVDALHLSDGVAGHALSFGGSGNVWLGSIDGDGTACTVTKTGGGTSGVRGPSTFGGVVTVAAGALRVLGDKALPAGTAVSVADDAILQAGGGGGEDLTWDNPITGAARSKLYLLDAALRLTGDCSGFAGSADVVGATGRLRVDETFAGKVYPWSGGVLAGGGQVGGVRLSDLGFISPGATEYAVAALTAAGTADLGYGTLRFDVSDAAGAAGAGYDTLEAAGAGGVIIDATASEKVAVVLRSSDGAKAASAAHFDPAQSYRWHVITATAGSINGFGAGKVSLDTTGFTNDLEGGSFSLALSDDGRSIDVVLHAVRRLRQGSGGRRRRRQLRQGLRADGGVGDGRHAAVRVGLQGRRRRPGLGDQRPARALSTPRVRPSTATTGPSPRARPRAGTSPSSSGPAAATLRSSTAPRTARPSTSSRPSTPSSRAWWAGRPGTARSARTPTRRSPTMPHPSSPSRRLPGTT